MTTGSRRSRGTHRLHGRTHGHRAPGPDPGVRRESQVHADVRFGHGQQVRAVGAWSTSLQQPWNTPWQSRDTRVASQESVIDEGQQVVAAMITQAERERERITSDSEVFKHGKREAERIVADALAEAEGLRKDADDYVDGKLANFEITLAADAGGGPPGSRAAPGPVRVGLSRDPTRSTASSSRTPTAGTSPTRGQAPGEALLRVWPGTRAAGTLVDGLPPGEDREIHRGSSDGAERASRPESAARARHPRARTPPGVTARADPDRPRSGGPRHRGARCSRRLTRRARYQARGGGRGGTGHRVGSRRARR